MNNSKAVQEWLRLARLDLGMAKDLFRIKAEYYPGVAYHCQQCAEKSIKALLVHFGKRPEKTHDIEALNKVSLSINEKFNFSKAVKLTEFAIAHRYPDSVKHPITKELCEELMELAQTTYDSVIAQLNT